MPRVRLKFKPPSERWIGFSTEHPDNAFRILSYRPTEEGVLVVIEAETATPDDLVHLIDEAPEVHSYEVLQADRASLRFRCVISEPAPYRAARSAGFLGMFPVVIRDGWLFIQAVTSHDRLSQFTTGLKKAGITFEVLSVTQSVDTLDLLTDRQWEFITEAVESGYYDTPRECSLVDLAAVMDVDPSTASGILHRAEERIIKEFIS